MLVIAHPDDESMFFAPFLFHNTPSAILCLSRGNYDSLGDIRSAELNRLCTRRGWNLEILNHRDGQDWKNNNLVVDIVDACRKYGVKNIVTFDSRGVSGHKNHISCYKAVKTLRDRVGEEYLRFHCLRTVGLFEKYVLSLRSATYVVPIHSTFGWENMMYHRSQLLWFRYAYMMFGSYMHFNEMGRIQ